MKRRTAAVALYVHRRIIGLQANLVDGAPHQRSLVPEVVHRELFDINAFEDCGDLIANEDESVLLSVF